MLGPFVTAVALLLAITCANAAQRTFVSTNGSNTSISCSLANPCRSFDKAMTVTDPNGEIIALDSGGYGRVTIDRSVSIIAPPGVYAGISVFGGDNGVDINAPGAKVVLRGLFINGQGGSLGINLTNAAELHIDSCSISNFLAVGIEALAGKLYLHDTLIRNNGNAAVLLSAADAQIDRVRIEANGGGGISVSSTSRVSIRDSLIADNAFEGVSVTAGALTRVDIESTTISGNARAGISVDSLILANKAEVTVTRSTIARNGSATSAEGVGASGTNAHLSITDSTVTGNYGYGMIAANGATFLASNNVVTKNGLQGLFNTTSTFNSRGDNTVQDNFGGASGGTITTVGGL